MCQRTLKEVCSYLVEDAEGEHVKEHASSDRHGGVFSNGNYNSIVRKYKEIVWMRNEWGCHLPFLQSFSMLDKAMILECKFVVKNGSVENNFLHAGYRLEEIEFIDRK